MSARVNLGNDRIALQQAETRLVVARGELARAMGQPGDRTFALVAPAGLEGRSRGSSATVSGALSSTAGRVRSCASASGSRAWAETATVALRPGLVPATLKASQQQSAVPRMAKAGPKPAPA